MKDSIQNQIQKARKDYDTALVCYFNDGVVRKDSYSFVERMKIFNAFDAVRDINRMVCDVASSEYSAANCDVVEANINIGLIYKVNDVDEDDKPKAGAKPVNGIVRVYDGPIYGYNDDIQTYTSEGRMFPMGFNSFARYDDLVRLLKFRGYTFEGPKTFKEFKELINAGEPFEIKVSVDLKPKEVKEEQAVVEDQPVVEEQPVIQPEEPVVTRKRCLFKRKDK